MRLIVVVSDNYGVAYNGRRQSRDAVLVKDMLEMIGTGSLYCDTYSEAVIPAADNVIFGPDYLSEAGKDDYCFYEKGPVCPDGSPEEIVLYHWNREYPADEFFEFDRDEYTKVSEFRFKGKSHDEITREIWTRV